MASSRSAPSNMSATLHFALRIPYQNAKASDFLFKSLNTSPFHPFYPLTSICDDNTLPLTFKRVALPPLSPINELPDGPDMQPDGIPTRTPLHISGPISLTYVATSDNIIMGYGLIDYRLSGIDEQSLASFCGIFRFVCDVRTSECIFTACYGNPRCIMIRAMLDSPTGHRQIYKIAVPDSEYVWPYLPTVPLCSISEILSDSLIPSNKSIPGDNFDTLHSINRNSKNTDTTFFDGFDDDDFVMSLRDISPCVTDSVSTPLSPITPPSPIQCPLSPGPGLPSDVESDSELICTRPQKAVVNSSSATSAYPLSSLPKILMQMHSALVGKVLASALRVDYSSGETIYTRAAMTSFRMVSPDTTAVQREKMWVMFLFAMNSRGASCMGRCLTCKLPCSTAAIAEQREYARSPQLVKIAPKAISTQKELTFSFIGNVNLMKEHAGQERLVAIRKGKNRLSAARSYQRRRQRESSLEYELSHWRAQKNELLSRETDVREENKHLKWMLMEARHRSLG